MDIMSVGNPEESRICPATHRLVQSIIILRREWVESSAEFLRKDSACSEESKLKVLLCYYSNDFYSIFLETGIKKASTILDSGI
jgi:hypothetical protein